MALSLKSVKPMGLLIVGSVLTIANEGFLFDAKTSFGFVSRENWAACPAIKPGLPLAIQPPPYVIISHTATGSCNTIEQCTQIVRNIQNFHMTSQHWDDIGYNFLVGGDGNVFEGRGWNVQGAHTRNYNSKSIGISFIGTFNQNQPTDAQLQAAKNFLEDGLKNENIRNDYKLLGHRQCSATTSPGDVLYNIIKTWDHWSSSP